MIASLPLHDAVAVLRPDKTFLLRNRATGRLVVLKRLAGTTLAAAERRVRALRPLSCGWSVVPIDGVPHLVRPFVPGRALSEAGPAGDRDVARAGALARAIAAALAPIHARGVAHGEVHPGNLVETDAGGLALVDGVEPFRGAPEPNSGESAREASYAAPEVVRGDAPTRRADVWAIGVFARTALTGEHPFAAADAAATAARILYERPLSIALARPDVPDAFARAVDGALAATPRLRPAGASAFTAAIEVPAVAPSRPAAASESAPAAEDAPAPAPPAARTVAAAVAASEAHPPRPLRREVFARLLRGAAERARGVTLPRRLAMAAVPGVAVLLLWAGGDDPLAREVDGLIAAGDLRRAAEVLDRAAPQRPDDPRVEKLRGDLACARGSSAECLRRYRAALEARPALADDPTLRENVLGSLAREDERGLAVRVASRIDGVDDTLLERTRSDRYWTRWNAVRALEARGKAQRIDYAEVYAKDLLEGGSCATRRAAAAKLAELRDPRTLPALEKARDEAGAFGWFCTGDAISRAIAAVRNRDGG